MIKTRDGYSKLIGTEYNGSSSLVLLSNGGNLGYSVSSTADTLVQRNSSGLIESSVASTLSPFKITSTYLNTNLNADFLDGVHKEGLLTGFANVNTTDNPQSISVTVGGTTKYLQVAYAQNANLVGILGSSSDTNYPLLFTSAANSSTSSGVYYHLYTDTANSLYYNPSTNTLRSPRIVASTSLTSSQANIANYIFMNYGGEGIYLNSNGLHWHDATAHKTNLLNFTADGLVGVGKTPDYKLDVNGTFNSANYQVGGELELKTDDTACQTTVFGSNHSGYRMRIVRLATSTSLNTLYSPTLVLSSLDTHAYIAWRYDSDSVWVGGGSSNKWSWRSKLLTSTNYTSYVNNYYWANIKVSTTSNSATSPTFGGLTVNGTSILNGLVGIGVLSPKAKLAVNTSALSTNPSSGSLGTVNTMSVGAAGSYGTYFWTRGTGKGYILVGREDGTATVYDLILQVLGGNVGIGKESPSYRLDVASTARVASIVMEYNNEINVYGSYLYLLHRGTVAGSQGDARTSNIYMCANGGNVGIGTASLTSGYRVTVNGGVTATRFQTGSDLYNTSGGIILNNSDIYGLNAIYTSDLAGGGSEGYLFKRTNGNYDSIWCKDGTFYFSPDGNNSFNGTYNNNYVVLHSGNYTSYSTQSKIWTASTTVNAWRRILTINGYSNVLLSMCWSLSIQASLHLYLINTGYLQARIVQLGYNGYSYNYSVLIRVTYTAATTFHVEVYNSYGYNGATTLSVGCRATVLDNTCSITTITANTAGGGTSLSSLTSHYNIAKNFYAERATVADSLYTGSASGSSHANALQTYFNANKASIPRGKTISFSSSAYSNGSLYMGYFISGYDSNPYGGFFVAHYGTPYYVGIINGSYSQSTILTTGNYTSTLDGRYVNVTGDTMTGTLILKGSTSTDMTYSGNTHPAIRFDNSDSSQNIKFIFTDYDTYRSPAGIKLIGNQGGEWFEVSGNVYGNGFVKSGSSDSYALLGAGGHRAVGNASSNIPLSNGTVCTNLNADMLDGYHLSALNVDYTYTISCTSLSDTNFYPIVFSSSTSPLRCRILSSSRSGSHAWNLNTMEFVYCGTGWSDTPHRLTITNYGCYSNSEITIGCIGRGNEGGVVCIWVRGGSDYYISSNRVGTLKSSNYTSGNEIFTVGTNYYGGSNTKVTIMFTPQSTISTGNYTNSNFKAEGNSYAAHFYENSDIRYKTVINNLAVKANQLANLPLFDFKWKDNENLLNTGTSAQAVQELLPYIVSGEDKLTLDYGVLGTIAGITACKELTEQEKEIEKLKKRVKELEDKLILFNL